MGVAGGYPASTLPHDDPFVLAETEYEARQPGRYFLTNQIRESTLGHCEPLAQEADGLHPHFGVAKHKLLEVLPPEDEQGRRLESLDAQWPRESDREAALPYNGPLLDHGDGEVLAPSARLVNPHPPSCQ